MPETFIPIVLFIAIAWVFYAFISARHKERMTIIEKGLIKEDLKYLYSRKFSYTPNPFSSLKWGIILVTIGIGLVLAMFIRETYNVEEGIYPIMLCLSGGIGLVLFYLIARKKEMQPPTELK